MNIEELLKQLRIANDLASQALATSGDAQEVLWERATRNEASIQAALDLEVEGLIVHWSTAHSTYIIRAER